MVFDPLVEQWFTRTYGEPTDIQTRSWEAIAGGHHVLMTAPTGSGKTLAAFLWALNRLICGDWSEGCTRVLYISPLKALNNDIRRNLLKPLDSLRDLFQRQNRPFPRIRVMTRSGDSSPSERRRMLRQPPEILITTPESLNLLLSSAGGRAALPTIKTVILDEIHAIMDSRRGTYLMTAVERLTRLAGEFQRIALSATIKPLETAARFVGGYTLQGSVHDPQYTPRPVEVVESGLTKEYELSIKQPAESKQTQDPKNYWAAYAECIKTRVHTHRSTLVFTNSRRLCEKITYLMNRSSGELLAYAHHGSLSREIRSEVERNLKDGKLKAIVATGSLELGIDIGALDEVILLQSPVSVAQGMQRVGRSGHQVGEKSRGIFYPSHAMDIVSSAVLLESVDRGEIESMQPVMAPLDVLAQIILSMCAFESWDPRDLYHFIRTAYPYRNLGRRQFDLVIELLEGRFQQSRIRELKPRISHDRVDQTLKTKKGALLALYSSGGVIPDRGNYVLRHDESGARIGELDEEFVWEARIGQVFTLGTQNWKIRKITHSDVLVGPARGSKPAPPFWRAEDSGRGFHLSEKIGRFMEAAQADLKTPTLEKTLQQTYRMDENSIDRLKGFLLRQQAHTGCALPHRHHVVIEFTTLGPGGAAGNQVVWHTLWGGRVNRPLAMALEAAWEERYGSPLQIFAGNEGISFILPHEITAEELLSLAPADQIEAHVHQRLAGTGFFGARFRECAGRALLLPRRQINMRMPLWLSRLRAQKLMAAVAHLPDFPILVETWRTCLQDEFEVPILKQLLREMETGRIQWTCSHTAFPSPLAQNLSWQPINTAMYLTDQPVEGKTGPLSSDLLYEITLEPGLRPRVARTIVQQFEQKRQRLATGYAPDGPEDLLDWVKERIFIPWSEWQMLLKAAARDHGVSANHLTETLNDKLILYQPTQTGLEALITALEMLPRWLTCFNGELLAGSYTLLSGRPFAVDEAPLKTEDNGNDARPMCAALLGEWLRFYGPRPRGFVEKTLGLSAKALHPVLDELLENRDLISGHLVHGGGHGDICDRENFEILLRLARKEAVPAFETLPIETLPLFLAHFQGLTQPADSLEDLTRRLNHLLAWPAPADLWESDLLPARSMNYRSDRLDRIIRESELRWIGFPKKKIVFCFENELDLIFPDGSPDNEEEASTDMLEPFPHAHGRYPFSHLQQHTGQSPRQLNEQLWDLVWRGRATNDDFGALRRGIDANFKMPEAGGQPAGKTGTRYGTRRPRPGFRQWKKALPALGNWFRVPAPEPSRTLLDIEEQNKERVRLLLDRYGILFRELLSRELPLFGWKRLFRSLRLMELSGEVMAGRFFHNIQGPQFISPQAYGILKKELPQDAVFWLNAVDPASLCGLGIQGIRKSLPKRLNTNHLVYCGTRLVVISRQNGKHLQIKLPADHVRLKACLAFLDHLLSRRVKPLRRIIVESINDRPTGEQRDYLSVLTDMFETTGDQKGVCLYRRYT